MHPTLFERWWRNESARVQQRAEMAAVIEETRRKRDRERSSWAVRVSTKLGSGLRRAGRVSAGVLDFGQRVPRRLSLPVAATIPGKRG